MVLVPAVLAGAAVLFGLLFLVEERVRGARALRAWEDEMRGRGEKLGITEIAPAIPTNPAVRIVDPVDAQGILGLAIAPQNAPGGMQMVASGKARLIWAADQWLERDGQTNGWRGHAEALGAMRAPLAELRSVLTNRSLFIRLDYEQGFEMLLPHLGKMKSAMLALNAGTVCALHEGRLDEAYENLVAATDLLDLVGNEPLLISQLVRIADAAIIQGGLWEALQADVCTDDQLAVLQERWAVQDFVAGLGRSLEGERALAALAYDLRRYSVRQLLEMMGDLQSLGFGGGGGSTGPRSEVVEMFGPVLDLGRNVRRAVHLACWRFAWVRHDQLYHHRALQTMIEAARRAAEDRQWQASSGGRSEHGYDRPFGSSSLVQLGAYDRLRYWLSPMILPSMNSALDKAARMDVGKEQIVAAIALKRHRLRHGRLPPTLEALVPEFLDAVPRDWFAAAPLRYRPEEAGDFLLYSVGVDGVDDGGDSRDSKDEVRSVHAGRDLVWPQRASPEEVAAADLARLERGGKSR